MRIKLLLILTILLLGNSLLYSQTELDSLKPNPLVLEINYFKNDRASNQTFFVSPNQPKGTWTGLFRRVAGWRQPENTLPVRAVNIVSNLESGVADIKVSVFTGRKGFEKEENVAEFELRENDKISVTNLTKFGVEPFELSLVRLQPAATILPRVVNKTVSVEIVGLEPIYSAVPSYRLIVANNSEKSISAFSFDVSVDGRKKVSGMPQNTDETDLIKPGMTFEKMIPNATELVKVLPGQAIPVQANQTLTISAVIFEDGSFEGEPREAGRFLAFRFGRKLQLEKIGGLLRTTAKTPLTEIERQADDLAVEVSDADFEKFTGDLQGLTEDEKYTLRTGVNVAMQSVRREFIGDIQNLAGNGEKRAAVETENRLGEVRSKYQRWLDRLK